MGRETGLSDGDGDAASGEPRIGVQPERCREGAKRSRGIQRPGPLHGVMKEFFAALEQRCEQGR